GSDGASPAAGALRGDRSATTELRGPAAAALHPRDRFLYSPARKTTRSLRGLSGPGGRPLSGTRRGSGRPRVVAWESARRTGHRSTALAAPPTISPCCSGPPHTAPAGARTRPRTLPAPAVTTPPPPIAPSPGQTHNARPLDRDRSRFGRSGQGLPPNASPSRTSSSPGREDHRR